MSDQHRRRRHNPDGSLIPHGTRYSLGAAPRQPSARHVDSSQEDTGWTRYTDPNTGYDYLYNATTGESRWVEEHRKDHAARRIQRSLSRRGQQAGARDRRSDYTVAEPRQQNARVVPVGDDGQPLQNTEAESDEKKIPCLCWCICCFWHLSGCLCGLCFIVYICLLFINIFASKMDLWLQLVIIASVLICLCCCAFCGMISR